MGKIQAPVIMNEAPASDEYGIVVRPVGGSGSAVDATIVAPLPLPVTIEGPLGSRPSAESVSVALASDQIPLDVNASINIPNPLPVTGPLTDAEFRAVQTATGNIAGNGQSVTLELNGAKSTSVRFTSNSFSGTVRFYTSNDGINFDQCQGLRPYPFDVVNFKTPAWNGDSSTWVFCLNGGETHVRITSVSYTSGDVDILLVATEAPTSAILNAMANAGDTNQPLGALAIAGTRDTGLFPISARSSDPPSFDIGLVVRNISGLAQNGNPVNGDSVYIHKIAGYDERAGSAQLARVLDEAPLDNDFGVVTRNIPSGIQEVSGTVSVNEPVTVDGPLTDTELRASAIPTTIPNITSSGILGALNDAVTINAEGKNSVGCYFIPGTLNGTLVLEQSPDGINWFTVNAFAQRASGIPTQTTLSSFLTSDAWDLLSYFTTGNSVQYRIRVSSYSSGSGSALMIASSLQNTRTPFESSNNQGISGYALIGGWNGISTTLPAYVRNSTPNSGDNGLVVRPVTSNVSPVTRTFATVGITTAIVVASNSVRKGLELVNTSPNRISLGIGTTAVLDSGITLYPRGSYVMDAHASYSSAISAIASAAGSNLGIQEYNA